MAHHVNHHHHHVAHEAREAEPEPAVATAFSVVYVTAQPTFTGAIGGYSTPALPQATEASNNNNAQNAAAPAPAPAPAPAAPAPAPAKNQPIAAAPAAPASDANTQAAALPSSIVAPSSSADTSSAVPSSIVSASSDVASSSAPASSSAQQTTLAQSVSSAQPVSSIASVANAQAAPSASASPVETKSSSSGLSSGGKAGLAVGLIALFAILGAIAFALYRRMKNQKNAAATRSVDNEKSNSDAGLPRSAPAVAAAPRLSLKPSKDNLPEEMNEKQAAAGGLAPVAAPTTRGRTPEPQPAQREPEKSNPFGDHAKLPEAADAALAPKPLNISRPGTPNGSEKSFSSATSQQSVNGAPAAAAAGGAAAAAAGGPGRDNSNNPLNVHRVQLDFAPSMDDELELKQGQLVRMLHEYDDGWCLCIRLDRSQQGVVPRSCLSKQAVKPRPAPGQRPNGAPQNGSRPTTPQSNSSASSKNGGSPRARANSNAPAPLKTANRPETPTQGPFGDGEYRARSNSAVKIPKPASPTPSYDPSNLSNSPNQSPPSSPESKQAPIARKPAPGSPAIN